MKGKYIEPYLKLIGFGELEHILGVRNFMLVSRLLDEVTDYISELESATISKWYAEFFQSKKCLLYTGSYQAWNSLLNFSEVDQSQKEKLKIILQILPRPV